MMLQWALGYAAIGWPVFRLDGKIPLKGSHGHLDATTDENVIRSWWPIEGGFNIGLACGAIVVFDADGPGGLAVMGVSIDAQGAVTWNGWPPTWVARTRRGYHFFYKTPPGVELRTHNAPRAARGADGLDLKGARGYVVLAPSVNAEGVRYVWLIGPHQMPGGPAELHPEGQALWEARRPNRERAPVSDSFVQPAPVDMGLGEPPAWATSDRLAEQIAGKELSEVIDALKEIPASLGYDDWWDIGAAIHDFDPTPRGLAIFQAWSRTSTNEDHDDGQEECVKKWAEYEAGTNKTNKITVATLFYVANIEREKRLVLSPKTNEINGNHVIPEGFTVSAITAPELTKSASMPVQPALIKWEYVDQAPTTHYPDLTNKGTVTHPIWIAKPTTANAYVAILKLGITCRYNIFHDRMTVGGHAIQAWAGDLSDNAVLAVRRLIKLHEGFDPGAQNTSDAAVQLCLEHQYNPVIDYLDSLSWDGKPRLERWLVAYMSAPDTELTRAIGSLALIAAVRRIRVPGTKFDQIIVLESSEGRGKSSAIEILAGADNFSDQTILTLDDRAQQEHLQGVWLYEIADLAGINRAEVERIKAFASRRVDRARPAYGRYRVDRPRTCIIFASTNDTTYLLSQTGNRRFWPVSVGRVDLYGLARDRDQLWAEASAQEKRTASLVLPDRLWAAAATEQEQRLEYDPWDSIIDGLVRDEVAAPSGGKEMRISTRELFDALLQIPRNNQTTAAAKRLAHIMRRHEWQGPVTFRGAKDANGNYGPTMRGYVKKVKSSVVTSDKAESHDGQVADLP